MVTGVILAGGTGRRMGGKDKGLVLLHGKPLVSWVFEALRPQVAEVFTVANRNIAGYGALVGRVAQDCRPEYPGPLAGIETALSHSSTEWIVTCPVDVPYLPADYVARLWSANKGNGAVATLGGRLQPVFALLHRRSLLSVSAFLDAGHRTATRWIESERLVPVPFDDCADILRDADTPQDLESLHLARSVP